MIKFFRKIRLRLLSEKRLSKYFLYAIGEIVLVIIGILIALAISDWNGNRLEKQAELRALNELKKGLLLDLELIKNENEKIIKAVEKIERLQELLKDPEFPYEKRIDSFFGAVYGIRAIRLNTAFYEDLKSSGLNLIKDDALRLNLVELFENTYATIIGLRTIENSINQVNRPYYLENFHDLAFWLSATPNDYKKIWADSYYKNIIDYRLITLESNQIKFYQNASTAIESLVTEINTYIESNWK
ncbi:MAG: hypothetical protein KJO25_04410 [Bacteroidia bacterium]|nr:hypothetical protein [Bacteroidia bacterium]